MATLSAVDLQIIRDMYAKRTVSHGPHVGNLNTACWNWALTGIVDQATMVRPEALCDFVSRDSLNAELTRQGSQNLGPFNATAANPNLNAAEIAWFGNGVNGIAINAIKTAWNGSGSSARGILAASKGIAKLAIEANGLVVVDHATDYKICVYYYPHVTQPNFQHWWVQVEGVWFELFPGLHDIQIQRDAQHLGTGKIDFSHYVVDLHQSQVDRIEQSLQGYNGGWWTDHSTKECTNCQSRFSFTTRKHHCRACGRIFCSDCTNHTKIVAHVIQRPDSRAAEHGRVRVCDACFIAP